MLEHVGDSQKQKDISMVLGMSGIITEKIDENLYRVLDTNNGNGYMGFVEVFTPRYFVFYTSQPSDIADSWVKT